MASVFAFHEALMSRSPRPINGKSLRRYGREEAYSKSEIAKLR
jgi:hypothetical protein